MVGNSEQSCRPTTPNLAPSEPAGFMSNFDLEVAESQASVIANAFGVMIGYGVFVMFKGRV
jgi:hypothetical protein